MIVNPGIRRFLGSAIQRLFNSASVSLPLTHTAVPTRGSITPSFTRATTATWPNNDGYMVTGVAGEIGFVGARRVRNLVTTASEDFSSADWLKVNTTVVANQAVSPNGATTADLVYPTTTGTLRYFWRTITGTSVVGSTKLVQSIYAKAAGMSWIYLGLPGTGSVQGAWFNVSTGVVGTIKTGALNPTIEDVGDGWYRCSLGQVDAVDISWYPVYSVADADNSTTATTNGTDGIYFWGAQLEDVTAQTTQTAGEYVSVGVPSDWAGTELVTNGTFDTATTGWTAYNLTGSIATISTDSGRLRVTNNAATGRGAAYQMVPTIVGAKYVISCLGYSGNSGAGQWGLRVGTSPGDFSLTAVSGADGVPLSAEFTATSTTTYLTPNNIVATANLYVEFDNINVKPAYYHGSFVDGVKCFPTDLSGNPIPSTTMLGYQAEGARTNLVWPSEDLTHVRYVSGGGGIAVVADQAVAPDGTTTADQLTASGANGTLIQDLGVIASAAQAFSLYLKRKTGTGNIDITLDGGATWTTQAITTTEWTRCQITQTVANPDVGIRIVTSGDAIYAWGLQCE